jgi:hypothetical protein
MSKKKEKKVDTDDCTISVVDANDLKKLKNKATISFQTKVDANGCTIGPKK